VPKNIITLEQSFSKEFKELISKSRDIAIELGYDYISTLHFFIADCENKRPASIFHFAFENESEFQQFKSFYAQHSDGLDLANNSLPLTKEAEKTVWMAIEVQKAYKQACIYPCHLFMASVKNNKSLLAECFRGDLDVVDNMARFYEGLGEFAKAKKFGRPGLLAGLMRMFSPR
jgi:hypothetical protein